MKIAANMKLVGTASMKQIVGTENISPYGGEARSSEIPLESRILQTIIPAKKNPMKKSSITIWP